MAFEIIGLDKLIKDFDQLGKVPLKVITPAVKKGMSIARKDARKRAPKDSGDLRRGIKLVGEKSKVKAKKVYQIVFDRKMNDVFRKQVKNPSEGRRDTAYYPISMEYGYYTRAGEYIKGRRFVRDALTENDTEIANAMVDTLKIKLDNEIEKRGLK